MSWGFFKIKKKRFYLTFSLTKKKKGNLQIKGTSKNSRDTNEHATVEGERFWSFNPRLKIRATGS